jgi:ribonuclease HII
MVDAIKKLKVKEKKLMVLVDGNKKIHGLDHEQTAIIKGDRKIFAIACASVIAKVFRDKMMARLAKRYPGYGLEIHKGYATKMHRSKIRELGPTILHRKSFNLK